MALGATRRAVLRAALQSTAIAVACGLGIGLTLSPVLDLVLRRWSIRNVDDPLMLAAVVGALLLTSVAAAVIPARRATGIEPAIALKSE
jgi:ABC-type antimicrobial peptide transport system permease subunit